MSFSTADRLSKRILIFFTIFSALFPVFSSQIPTGTSLCKETESWLKEAGLQVERQELSESSGDEFPFNCLVDIPAKNTEKEGSKENLERTTVILDFRQEDAYFHKDEILDMADFIMGTELKVSVQLLFTAPVSPLRTDFFTAPSTTAFASSVENPDKAATVCIFYDKDPSHRIKIITAGAQRSAPLWMVKAISKSCSQTDSKFIFKTPFGSLYRTGILASEGRLQAYILREIPAIGFTAPKGNSLRALENFLLQYPTYESQFWDSHYIAIALPEPFRPFFLGERILTMTLFAIGAIGLFILTAFSFIGKHRIQHKREFFRQMYFIPITFTAAFFALKAGEAVCNFFPPLAHANPVYQFGVKITISLALMSILFFIQESLHMPVATFVSSYVLAIFSIMNIFFFSAVDLLFFVIFSAEYILIYFARGSKRIFPLIFSSILMLLPFAPYAYSTIRLASDKKLAEFVFCQPLQNLLLTLAVFPFHIMWLRILIRINIFFSAQSLVKKRVLKNIIFPTFLLSAFIFLFLFSISQIAYRPQERAAKAFVNTTVPQDAGRLSVTESQTSFLGMTTHHISISSTEQMINCRISVDGHEENPVLYSSFEYVSGENLNKVHFIIPDFPPSKMTVDYASESNTSSEISVTAIYATEDEHKFTRETVVISSSGTDQKDKL